MKAWLPLLNEFAEEMHNSLNSCCNVTHCDSGLAVSEDDKKVYIDAPLPGVKSEDIEVTLDQERRSLKISGKAKPKRENVRYLMNGCARFYYEIPLSNAVDASAAIEAITTDGVLTVELSKAKPHNPLKIDVKVA